MPDGAPESLPLDDLTRRVVRSCAEVHRRLGPGLALAAYAQALELELEEVELPFQRNVELPVFYRGVRLAACYRLSLCVAGVVAVDPRTVPALLPVHRAELRAQLRVSGLDSGVLVNFHAARVGEGLVVLRRSFPALRQRVAATLSDLDASTAAPSSASGVASSRPELAS